MTKFRPASIADARRIADIYNYYVESTTATFEEEPVSTDVMSARISDSLSADLPWIVCEIDGSVIGYANAGVWKGRSAYRFTVEVTIYLGQSALGQGLGHSLYERLFRDLRGRGVHTAIGVIALPNTASVALHEKFGMQKAAHFREVGYKMNQWIDVGYWQVVFDE